MISDPIPFLANIALIAHADKKLSSSELGQMEAIRTEMKFRKSDFNKALKVVGDEEHRLTPVGSFADQVKNLELMLRVAYADSDLDAEESRLVSEFCQMIGIAQEQLNRIANEVLATISAQDKICTSCGSSAESDASFCPKCGESLKSDDQEEILVDFEIPAFGIAIEFADSTAAAFPKALEYARNSSQYQSCQKAKKTWHLASFPSGAILDALPLAQALSGIRNKTVYQDGTEKSWDEIFSFAWCAAQRETAYRPVEYCFGKDENRLNPWGCKQARMDWTEWADWFSYGAWEKGGLVGSKVVWRFDKERIQHELATNLYKFRYCPHMVTGLAEAFIRHLPDTVSPESDKNWTFDQHYEEVPGAIKVVEKEGRGAYSFTNEFWSNGVRPKGLSLFAKILTKAAAETGGCGMTPSKLLK